MTTFQSIILAIVEGITEFLPVSSTGHMVITSSIMGIEGDAFTKLFEIVIQLGAILAVVVLYWKKFFDRDRLGFYKKLIIAVLPALVAGLLLGKYIDQLLDSPTTVGVMLLAGGILLLFVDNWFKQPETDNEQQLTPFQALRIGLWQCIAMIPGVSRSAATIIGGMQQKLTRSFAAEFSFFLAVPTMAAATGYKLLKAWKDDPGILKDPHNMMLLALGNIVAFVVAMIAIKTFISYLQRHGFKLFGIYRIIVGVVILLLVWMGKLV